eukprot:Clim_evm19s158 gene=Clim_evmTU19s158
MGGGMMNVDHSRIIVNTAEYGKDETWIDVTDKVQQIASDYKDARICIARPKTIMKIKKDKEYNRLFGDPLPGLRKRLRIAYSFIGPEHSMTIPCGSAVALDLEMAWMHKHKSVEFDRLQRQGIKRLEHDHLTRCDGAHGNKLDGYQVQNQGAYKGYPGRPEVPIVLRNFTAEITAVNAPTRALDNHTEMHADDEDFVMDFLTRDGRWAYIREEDTLRMGERGQEIEVIYRFNANNICMEYEEDEYVNENYETVLDYMYPHMMPLWKYQQI